MCAVWISVVNHETTIIGNKSNASQLSGFSPGAATGTSLPSSSTVAIGAGVPHVVVR